jgi:transcription-repair coupling factor (superfamily II helicase)
VEDLRAQQDGDATLSAPPATEVKVDLPLSAYIPLHYVPDLTTRLGVYQRLVRPQSLEAINSLGDEIRDRFGPLPGPVRELLYVVELKAQARNAGVESIAQERRVLVIQLTEPVGGARLVLQKALGGTAQVGHSQVRLPLRGEWQKALVQTLEGLAAFKAEVLELTGVG